MDFLAHALDPDQGYCAGGHGTITPYENFNAEEDCVALKNAMKGLGTDESVLISILGNRTYKQRRAIQTFYKQFYGKDLTKELDSETSGNFCKTLKALLMHPIEYDAWTLNQAVKGLGTDEDDIIEIMVTRSNEQLKLINKAYKTKYKESLEDALIGDTSGDFRRLLVSLNNGSRDESGNVDKALAHKDAADLYEAGEKKWGTDEATFNRIMASRNFRQLVAMFEEYEKISNKKIKQVLKSELSGNLLNGMLVIEAFSRDPTSYFAQLLKKTMAGLGTKDADLIRLVVTRSEVDLEDIKRDFMKLTGGETLERWIEGDCSGDYKKLLLAIVSS